MKPYKKNKKASQRLRQLVGKHTTTSKLIPKLPPRGNPNQLRDAVQLQRAKTKDIRSRGWRNVSFRRLEKALW